MSLELTTKKLSWALAGNIVDIVVGFGTVMLVTGFFDQEMAGLWFLFVTIQSATSNLREGFVNNAIVRYSQSTDMASNFKTFKTSLVMTMMFEGLSTLLVVSLFRYFDWFGLGFLMMAYPVYSFSYAAYRWIFIVHKGQSDPRVTVFMNIGFLFLLVTSSLFVITALRLEFLVFGLGLSSLGGLVIGVYHLGFSSLWRAPVSKAFVKHSWRYGSHGLLREVVGTVSTRVGLFLCTGILSLSHTALLGVAQRYLSLLLIPNNAFQGLLFPLLVKAAQGNLESLKSNFLNQVARLSSVLLIIAFVITITSPMIVIWIHGIAYQGAIGLLVISIWTVGVFAPFGSAFGSVSCALSRPDLNSRIVMVNGLINIVLSYFLILHMGVYGAVLAPFLTELAGYLLTDRILSRELKIRYSDVWRRIISQYKSHFIQLKSYLLRA